ncbi:MAG: multidrug ABC transporter ATP-binding protein, partial [Methylotenera sp.]
MTLFTAATGAFEALLFALMGKAVDWLGSIKPELLWQQEKGHLLLLAALLLLSTILIAFQTLFKHQTLAGNFPMRLRWNFHRLMLNQ